jgi:hypothetical protein
MFAFSMRSRVASSCSTNDRTITSSSLTVGTDCNEDVGHQRWCSGSSARIIGRHRNRRQPICGSPKTSTASIVCKRHPVNTHTHTHTHTQTHTHTHTHTLTHTHTHTQTHQSCNMCTNTCLVLTDLLKERGKVKCHGRACQLRSLHRRHGLQPTFLGCHIGTHKININLKRQWQKLPFTL